MTNDVDGSGATPCSTAVRVPQPGEYVRMYGTLIEVQDVTPKERVYDYIFEEVTARVEGRINGKVIKEFTTFTDFYGKGTCVEHAIREAKEQQTWLGESSMEFVVVKIVSRQRMRPSRDDRENFYDRNFRAMKALECGRCRGMPEEVEEVVWSSLSQ